MSDAFEITLHIAARPETVYKFLTDADAFQQWMGSQSRLDPTTKAISVNYPNGDQAIGALIETEFPRRVVYSWGYKEDKYGLAPRSTRVVVELTPTSDGTLLSLRHEGLPTEDLRRNHAQGWRYYLGQLAGASATAQVAARVADTMRDYALAWNTDDSDERAHAVHASCEPSIVYQDKMAHVPNADALLAYIANARAFAPGVSLVVRTPQQCHEHLRFDWHIVGHDEQTYGSGVAVGRLNLDGRLTHIVSFWNE